MMRTTWTKYLVPLLLAVALAACGGGSGTGGQDPGPDPPPPPPPWPPPIPLLPTWLEPDCDSVAGPAIATLSVDGGITILPNDEAFDTGAEASTQSIAANPQHGGQIIAARGTEVYWSRDSGCSWEWLVSTAEPLQLVGQTLPWYVYGLGERGDILHVFSDYLFESGHGAFGIPFHAIDIAPALFSTLHALTVDGRIMRLEFDVFQQDAWQLVGWTPAGSSPRFIAVNPGSSYFEPAHIVLSMESGPPAVTFDSGETWTTSSGVLDDADSVRTGPAHFSNQRSPLGFKEMDIWIALERIRTDPDSGNPTEERAVARSTDGGRTFSDIAVADENVVLIDSRHFDRRLLFTRRNTPGEVWFPGGGCLESEPRLYHYQAPDDSLTVISWDTGSILGIDSASSQIAFNISGPGRKDVYYFGHRTAGTCD